MLWKNSRVPKYSFLHHFVTRFVFMILVPSLCAWWLYENVLWTYYAENALKASQVSMENSRILLDSSLNAASQAILALSGNREIVQYMDERSNKRRMFYGVFRNASNFCGNLCRMTPYMDSLRIYSDSSLVLYAAPFARMEDFPLTGEALQTLLDAGLQETVWMVKNVPGEEFPAIWGYQKLYTENYGRCIGYVEVQLSPGLLEEYFELVTNLSGDANAVYALYRDGALLCKKLVGDAVDAVPREVRQGYRSSRLEGWYENCLALPELELYVYRMGHPSDLVALPSSNMPSILIAFIILMLLGLFAGFFAKVAALSRRILAFSSHIQNSAPRRLIPFSPEEKSGRGDGPDELDTLILAYNSLIQTNNSLISQIEKMELLSQEARYQALQEQIHPHFIYGTLETIRMMALQSREPGGNRKTADMIYSLSSLLRYSISISARPVTLRDELEIARHYLEIQKIRFDDRMDYRFRVEEGLLGLELPSFLLQPILENAIVYGVSKTLEACELEVEAREETAAGNGAAAPGEAAGEEKSSVLLTVSNTGLPIEQQRLEEINGLLSGELAPKDLALKDVPRPGNGLALYNIKERLGILFEGKADMHLERWERGTRTVIRIRGVWNSDSTRADVLERKSG